MSSILGPIQKLSTVLSGLTSDSSEVIQRQFTASPEQPQPADFPALIIEMDWEHEHQFQVHSLGGAHHVYFLNILILVGVPSTTPISELHDRACTWIYPLAVKIFSNITLSGVDGTLMLGYGGVDSGQEDVFRYTVGGIQWNQQLFYGVRAKLPVKEDLTIPMA